MGVFCADEKDKHHMQTTLMCIIAPMDLGLQDNQFLLQKAYNPRALSFIPRELAE
jgi:hypothetical protein